MRDGNWNRLLAWDLLLAFTFAGWLVQFVAMVLEAGAAESEQLLPRLFAILSAMVALAVATSIAFAGDVKRRIDASDGQTRTLPWVIVNAAFGFCAGVLPLALLSGLVWLTDLWFPGVALPLGLVGVTLSFALFFGWSSYLVKALWLHAETEA